MLEFVFFPCKVSLPDFLNFALCNFEPTISSRKLTSPVGSSVETESLLYLGIESLHTCTVGRLYMDKFTEKQATSFPTIFCESLLSGNCAFSSFRFVMETVVAV